MKVTFFIAQRYLSGRNGKGIFSFFSIISILGIILGVAALISVISVMNGFQENMQQKIISLQSFHLSVSSFSSEPINYLEYMDKIKSIPHVEAVYPYIESAVLFNANGSTRGALLRGYDRSFFTSETLKKNAIVVDGSLEHLNSDDFIATGDQFSILYGTRLSSKLLVTVFTNSIFQPKIKLFTIKAFIKTGFYPIDSGVLYTTLENAQQLLAMPGKCSYIGIIVDKLANVEKVKSSIEDILPFGKLQVSTWYDYNRTTYSALKNEKTLMFFIVFMIILVSAFYIVSSQIMTVMNKQKEIGILKAIGFTPLDIKNIFIFNGIIIGTIGTLLGTSLGYIISLNLDAIFAFIENLVNGAISILYLFVNIFNSTAMQPEFQIFSRDIYYFDKVPVSINFKEVIIINIVTFLLVFFASLIPAHRASNVKPKEVIHNE